MSLQLENMQGDIESIKELLKCDDYPIDTSAMLNVSFNVETHFKGKFFLVYWALLRLAVL